MSTLYIKDTRGYNDEARFEYVEFLMRNNDLSYLEAVRAIDDRNDDLDRCEMASMWYEDDDWFDQDDDRYWDGE